MCSKDNPPPSPQKVSILYALMAARRIEGLATFGELYEHTIYKAVSKLTGIDDEKILEPTVIAILVSIWRYSRLLAQNPRPSILVYKLILFRVFKLLDRMGKEDRIQYLKKISPMNASAFESFPFK